jgi:subfamily B ATP-binding cassette protein MsbA
LNEVSAEKPQQSTTSFALVSRLARESIRPYAWWIVGALFCMGVVAATTGMTAWLLGPVVDDVFGAKNLSALWFLSGAVVVVYALKGLSSYGQATLMAYVGQRIVTDTQNRFFAHLSRMEVGFFNKNPTGTLLSRFTVDVSMIRAAVSDALTGFGKDLLMALALVVVMFLRDWLLALAAIFVFPVAVWAIVRLGKRMRKVTLNTQAEMGLLMALVEQTIQGIRVVKAYAMEEYEQGRVAHLTGRIFKLVFKAARIRAMASPIMESLGGIAAAVVIAYGGLRVIDGATTPGAFVSFLGALIMAYEPLKRLANLNASLQQGLAGAQRLFTIFDIEPGIREAPGAKDLPRAAGEIAFDGVKFSYAGARRALDGLSLTVPAGQLVALVGPSGAGKTTILNLIPRFYDVDRGSVTIDGHDVRGLTFASLRTNIALVSQEITLFDDTVRANIAYGRLDAGQDEIEAAARAAAAEDFIAAMPDGYDTMVGEHGLALSGGQRQRLAIARAILKDAPILLLDEATSSLDTESERQIQTAIDKLTRGRTTLVIAHRLSTVIHADLIHVIDDGRVVESGTHAELIAAKGAYARLYAMQFAAEAKRGPMTAESADAAAVGA